jgi:ribosomal protein L11 methylase PrmA
LHDEKFKEINLLDVGCGAGIFSIEFMMNNEHLKIKHLVLCDTDENALANSFQNIVYNKALFNLEKVTILKSNLLKDMPTEYMNYFDVVLANMPQTPSKQSIRSK